jgi:predicted Zn-ribbon and HTH transcriptional regulator
MFYGKRRIKPTRKYTSLGLTRLVNVSEGMCRQCAWEKIKLKCKILVKLLQKDIQDYLLMLRHTILLANYYTMNKLMRCKICGDRFTFKKEEITFSKMIDHIKSHYIDNTSDMFVALYAELNLLQLLGFQYHI